MRFSRRSLAWVLALALPLAAGCDIVGAGFHEQESDQWTRSYPLQAGGRVEVVNVNGKIAVTGTDTNTVEVVALRIGKGSNPESAKQALSRIEIREQASADLVRLETKLPSSSGFFGHGGGEVRYTIKLPFGAQVRLETVNGGIELEHLQGRAVLETTNGGIVARGLVGPVEASTTNGGIEVDLEEVAQDGVELECTNGGIRLRVPRNAHANVTARVTNGGIDVSGLEMEVIGEQTRRRLEGRLNGGGPRIQIEGTNGGIKLSGK
jgi:hypothetical protein